MCLRLLENFKIFLVAICIHNVSTLRLKSEKHSVEDKDHNASRRYNVKDFYNSSLASRRSTYRINMPMKVAKLILPQITNKNQETIIRIYPDKSAKAQRGNGSNYLLSLSYKKLNDMGAPNKLQAGRRACYYGERPGCCSVCCPGSMCGPSTIPGSCICCPRPICPRPPCCCCCCCSSPPPPPPPPPKKPPPPPCPMVCVPCNPCPRPPCRPICIPRPCHSPCRIPAPPVHAPILGPCVPAPPAMGPCHPPCFPERQPLVPTSLHPAPPIISSRPIVVDHPLKGPPIFIDQCRDVLPECRQYAKRGMCNHASPFHTIQQIRKICPFSCGICNNYDENAALLRRQTPGLHVRPAMRAKLNRALVQIIRNRDLEGNSTLESQDVKSNSKEEQVGVKKSHQALGRVIQSEKPTEGDELNSGSGEPFDKLK